MKTNYKYRWMNEMSKSKMSIYLLWLSFFTSHIDSSHDFINKRLYASSMLCCVISMLDLVLSWRSTYTHTSSASDQLINNWIEMS